MLVENISACQLNMTVVAQSDALEPIQNDAGNVYPNFPATLGALNALNDAELSDLLHFYGRVRNPVGTPERCVKQLLGIRSY